MYFDVCAITRAELANISSDTKTSHDVPSYQYDSTQIKSRYITEGHVYMGDIYTRDLKVPQQGEFRYAFNVKLCCVVGL
jgi:hypothetical protein